MLYFGLYVQLRRGSVAGYTTDESWAYRPKEGVEAFESITFFIRFIYAINFEHLLIIKKFVLESYSCSKKQLLPLKKTQIQKRTKRRQKEQKNSQDRSILACIFLCMTGSKKWALRILFIFSMVFGLVNHYVMEFRSTPFVPWDIFSIRTATSVVGGYHFTFGSRVIIVTLIFIFLFIFWYSASDRYSSFFVLLTMFRSSDLYYGVFYKEMIPFDYARQHS